MPGCLVCALGRSLSLGGLAVALTGLTSTVRTGLGAVMLITGIALEVVGRDRNEDPPRMGRPW